MHPQPRANSRSVWFADLGRDLRQVARSLCRNPTFAAVTVTSLGLGLGLVATTLAITNAYLIRSLPYPDAQRLYHVRYAPPGPYEPRGMTALDWDSISDVVESTIISGGVPYHLVDGRLVQFVQGMRVSPGFIDALGVRPVLGQTFSESDFKAGSPTVALLGYSLWRDRFNADPTIVGREIQAIPDNQSTGTELIRVIGVLPPRFWFGRSSDARPDLLVPLRAPARAYMVRLRQGVPVALAEQRITAAARAVGSDFRPGWAGVQLESAHARYVAELRPLLLGISAAAGVVLVLVCANIGILFLLRALRRQRDVAVRVALGAERRHLLRMLVAEAGLVCAAALGLGLVMTTAALRIFAPVIETRLGKPPPGGPAAILVDGNVVLMIGVVGLVAALSLALIPLLVTRRSSLSDTLRRGGPGATEGPAMRRLQSVLIGLEVAGALVLLVAGGLMIRSLLNLVGTDLGFEADHRARVSVMLPTNYRDPAAQAKFWLQLAEKLADRTPGSVLGSSFPPFYESHKRPLESDAGAAPSSIGGLTVGTGYFALYGIEVLQGREFALSDRFASEPVAVVSESLAREFWPESSAIGRRIRGVQESVPDAPLGPWRTIVGVVRDVRQTYSDGDLRDVYFPFLQAPTRFGSVQMRTDLPGVLPPSRFASLVAELDPFVRVGVPRLITSEDRQLERARFMTALLSGFAGFGTLLVLLGLYGVTAYAVHQREREIAIRVAVGASHRSVIAMFLREGATVLAIGIALGLWAASAAGRVLESQIHGVEPFDLGTLLTASALLVTCGLLAMWWPARRATSGDLLTILKQE